MGFQLKDLDKYMNTTESVAETFFSSDNFSCDFYSYKKGNRLVIHQREDEIHNQLFILVLEGEIEVCIEDKKFLMHKNQTLFVQDIYIFELYCKKKVKLIYATTGLAKINDIGSKIKGIISSLESKDIYTKEHNTRVSEYASQIMHVVNSSYNSADLNYAALFHDVGKINVPEEILNKPGKFTKEEFDVMKKHPQDSYDIIKEQGLSENVAEIALQHQERLDGSGYPRGLESKDILEEAKVLAIADVFDALTTSRSYREAYSMDAALTIMEDEVKNFKLDKECYNALKHLINNKAIKV